MALSGNRNLAKWLEDFIETLKNKETSDAPQQTKTAEINIQDLQKVVWNDETFYVMFDNNNAVILNEFANKVTTLENCNTIEQVDTILNSKQVVAEEIVDNEESEDPFDVELKKVSSYLKEADDITNQPPTNTTPNANPSPVPVPEQDVSVDPNQVQDPNEAQDPNQTVANIESELEKTSDILNINEKMAKLEETISELNKKIEALTQQEYAHTDPGSVYDLNSDVAEIQHFEEAAQQMEHQIELEHQVDISTMEGRVSLKDKLLQDISNVLEDNLSDEVNDLDFGDSENEEQFEEEQLEEEPEVLEVPEITEIPETPEVEEDSNVELDQDVEQNDVVLKNETEEVPSEDVVLDEENLTDKKDIRVPKVEEDGITKLNSRDSKIFTNKLCIKCGENNLVKSKKIGSFVGIVCQECNAEYAVNLESGDIYNKN